MFSKNQYKLFVLVLSCAFLGTGIVSAAEAMKPVRTEDLPVNAANKASAPAPATTGKNSNALVSPSRPQNGGKAAAVSAPQAQAGASSGVSGAAANKDDFNFDLKMKSINASGQAADVNAKKTNANAVSADLPQNIQYKANPVEGLSNSVLSQMDSDLFSQMSEIEKSTTLLTLELKREKIRNEIEAQKAVRQKNLDDLERQRAENRLKDLERQKKIEAQVIQEQQALIDKEQIFEVLKQRKLLNAYMNQMLVNQQEWIKEKESLYAQLKAAQEEKKELIELFKQRIDKVLDASAKNIQTAEAAKANFERIVKGLKARNEQLRKRVEADAKIIKNAKNSLFMKSKSVEELKEKATQTAEATNAQVLAAAGDNSEKVAEIVEEAPKTLSSQYAILGITGRAGAMSIEVISANGQPMSLKVGSPLPSGHIVSEIGSDYAKFSRDGVDDYLYVGRSIDGVVPVLSVLDAKK